MKIMLMVSYDGTNYCGWQRQNGQITIQQVIEEALSKLYGEKIEILGAGRTDSGVHALGQRATFSPPDNRIPHKRIYLALNASLPNDIRVLHSEKVPDSFNVISDAIDKTYVYRIENNAVYNPLMYRYSYNIREPLNIVDMQIAAGVFVGTYDFKGFCSANGGAKTTVRTINSFKVSREGCMVELEVNGNGFLYNMVRIMSGTILDVGMGKIKPEQMPDIICSGNRKMAGRTLPAKGLTLVSIRYNTEETDGNTVVSGAYGKGKAVNARKSSAY